MKRLFRKAATGSAWIAAAFTVLLVIFYAEEDWRGARDWADCQRELATKGETLNLRQLAPPGKPEDDLSRVPVFAPLLIDPLDTHSTIEQLNGGYTATRPKASNYLRGEFTDLAAWQRYYRTLPNANLSDQGRRPAQDVLQVLSRFDAPIDEINSALSNPAAYWPISYDQPFNIRFSAMVKLISLAKILKLRGIAHLENGQTDLAEKDYLQSFHFNPCLNGRGFLVGLLVAFGVRAIDDSILFEGLARHVWNDSQLRGMESALASSDMLDLAINCFRGERGYALENLKYAQKEDPAMGLYGDTWLTCSAPSFGRVILWCRPRGWWDLDRREYCLGIQEMINSVDLSNSTVSPLKAAPVTSIAVKIVQGIVAPHSTETLPGVRNGVAKLAYVETYCRLARIACRLEEFRFVKGKYPDALRDLPDLPAHLNEEVKGEAPFHYQTQGQGYSLYSIGWNQKDSEGTTAMYQMDASLKEIDWAWPSPVIPATSK